jgi:hypothetical protein
VDSKQSNRFPAYLSGFSLASRLPVWQGTSKEETAPNFLSTAKAYFILEPTAAPDQIAALLETGMIAMEIIKVAFIRTCAATESDL